MLLTADLHLRPESRDTCMVVLEALLQAATERGHTHVAILGDVFHTRYAVDVESLAAFDAWLRRCERARVQVLLLPGNHDQIDMNGTSVLDVFQRPGVRVYSTPTEDAHGLWLPYRKETSGLIDAANRSRSPVAFVHHGLIGARMNTHVVAGETDGLPPALFSHFQTAFFGHWHSEQQLGNCVYVGSAWQTRADEADQSKSFIELLTDGAWSRMPVKVGRRYHRTTTDVVAGDVVFLGATAPKETVDHLRAAGVDVQIAAPVHVTEQRLGVAPGASLREYALRYVEERAGDLDRAFLLKLYEEATK